MTLASRHRFRNSSPGGPRPSTLLFVTEAPHNTESLRVSSKETFCFFETWMPERRTNPPSPTASTNAPGPPPDIFQWALNPDDMLGFLLQIGSTNVPRSSTANMRRWPNVDVGPAVNQRLMFAGSVGLSYPAKMRRWPNIGSLVGQRRRRWANSKPPLGQRLMFAG